MPGSAADLRLDRTEVTISDFAAFADATGFITAAERNGGMVYEAGWVTKPNWNWRQPYGVPAPPNEPAVHITFDEAEAYCRWRKNACRRAMSGFRPAMWNLDQNRHPALLPENLPLSDRHGANRRKLPVCLRH